MLFSELELSGRLLRNRLAMAPMTRQVARADGTPTPEMAAYYARRARGGVGLVITEGVCFSETTGAKAYPHQPAIITGDHVDAWRNLTSAVHREGALCVMQLQHAGRLADPLDLAPGCRPISASETLAPGYVIFTDSWEEKALRGWDFDPPFRAYVPARAMTLRDLELVAEEFATAASLAIAAGFDGVEVHAANGFLLDQFLNADVNTRTDGYGGSPTERTRYPREVCARVRDAVGDRIVTLRLSQDRIDGKLDRFAGGVGEAQEIGAALRDTPIDALHWASFDWADTRDPTNADPIPAVLRRESGKPVIANGGIHEPETAEAILAGGVADMVAIGRPLLANPDWPKLVHDPERPRWVPFERRWVIDPAT